MADNPPTNEAPKSKRIEFKRPGYRFELEITADADQCTAVYEPVSGGAPLTRDELYSYLGQLKIVEGIRDEAVTALTAAALQGKGLEGLLLAAGTPMIPGEPGRIALAAELAPKPEPVEPVEPPRGGEPLTVDFHQVQDFVNVDLDGLIGKVVPPGAGIPGRAILGSMIPARRGKEFAVKLGKNARLGADGVSLFAEAAGRVCVRGEEVSVEEIYQIAGDVNFKVGNIDFNGAVEIRGDILDGFKVKAKDIKVQGNIGACQIESPGNISFCGMNGQGKGAIICGGNLTANFIYEATLEVAGDVLVDAEIRSCHIHSLGAVKVNKGGIVGGECVALAGVEAGMLGCVTSLHTNVVAGVSYQDMEELNQRFNELKSLVARFNAADKSTVDPKGFQQERAAITGKIHEVRTRTYERTNPKVNVRKMLYSGTTITLGGASEEMREERPGPVSIIENTIEGGFRFLGMTDLAFPAVEIEKAFVQQSQLDEARKD